jgi:hypothetical protein
VAAGNDAPLGDLDLGPGAARFEIRRRLGAGGFGTVYEVFDRERHARVALKTMDRRDPRAVYRFKQEFRALAELAHPNLVQLYELHGTGERWFFTMELVPGVDAHTYVRAGAPAQASGFESTLSPTDPAAALATVAASAPAGPHATPTFDEPRLRAVLRQLAEGLSFLHESGRLHRDIKPSNVMVTPGGRVVLLDFGLVVDLTAEGDQSTGAIAGTPLYMAPEQGRGDPVGPAADWYAVGVMLYEALTGRTPFEGSGIQLLLQKLTDDPPPPGPGVPEDLARLCMDLLQRAPSRRPSGREILERLARHGPEAPAPARTAQGSQRGATFVGRAAQLAALREASATARAGGTVAALVHGQSGMGKSALIARFLDDLREVEPGAVILAGRCFEQESVPYKALDSLVDALGRHLRRMEKAEVLAILPRNVDTLARLFPALGRVPAVEAAPRRAEGGDQLTLRLRAFAALRELFARLGDRAALTLVIDDVQWGDADSGLLLADLLRPPDAPRMLVVLAYRSDEAEHSECLRALLPALRAAAGPALGLPEIAVEALDEQEARELALRELTRGAPPEAEAPLDRAAAIARESGGWPFFIRELGRPHDAPSGAQPSLEAMLWARVSALPDGARRLLEVIAVAGQPIDRGAAVKAAALGDDGPPSLGLLRKERLVRVRGDRSRDEIEAYHDRIRETVIGRVAEEAKRQHHLGLANALVDAGRADEETLAVHFQGAGETARAVEHAVKAADHAMEALGFDRAARLYRQALALVDESDPRWRTLHEKLGAALGSAGRGPEAAAAYLVSVEGAGAQQALDLRRRAAEHYLMSGHIEEGLAVFREVLAATGLSMPATPLGAVIRMLSLTVFLWLRGLRFLERAEGEIPAGELLRVDACEAAAFSLISSSPMTAIYFGKRFLALALRAGEPYRVLRALLIQVSYAAAVGGGETPTRSAAKLERMVRSLIERLRGSGARFAAHEGGIEMVWGLAAMFRCHFREAREHLERAVSRFEGNPVRLRNDVAFAAMFLVQMHYALGEWREMARRLAAFLEEARARGDLFLEIEMSKLAYVPALMEDRPDAARDAVSHVEALWSRAYHSQRYTLLLPYAMTALYHDAGAGDGALELVNESWPALVRSGMLIFSKNMRAGHLHVRGCAHLAAAAAATGARREELLRAVERDARMIGETRMTARAAYGTCLRAGAAAGRGERERARELLVEAAAGLERAEMALLAVACRRRLGELLGGEEGSALVAAADAAMAAQGIRNPARMTAMFMPGAW